MERRPLLLADSRTYGSFNKEEMAEKIPRGNPRMLTVVSSSCSCLTLFLLDQLCSLLLLQQPAGGGLTSSLMTGTLVVSAPVAGLATARSGSRTVSVLGAVTLSLGILMISLTWSSMLGVCVMTAGCSLVLISVTTSLLETCRPNYRTSLAVILAGFLLLHHLPPLPVTDWVWPVLPVLCLLTAPTHGDGDSTGGGGEGGGGGGGGGVGVTLTVSLAVVLGVVSSLLTGEQVLIQSSLYSLPPSLLSLPCLVVSGALTDLAAPSRPLLLCRTSLCLAAPLPFLLAYTDHLLIFLPPALSLQLLLSTWSLTAATTSLSSLPLSLGLLTSLWTGGLAGTALISHLLSPEIRLFTAGTLLALSGALYHLAARLRHRPSSPGPPTA